MPAYDYLSGSDALLQNVFSSHAAQTPDKPWCVQDDVDYSYALVDENANRLANAFVEYGVAKGDRVAVLARSRPEYFYAMFAAHRVGAVLVPCSPRSSADELGYQLNHSEPTVIVVDDEYLPLFGEVEPVCPSIRTCVVIGEPGREHHLRLADALREHAATPARGGEVVADDLAMILYTSGTTQRPKGVMYTHGNLISAARTTTAHFRWTPEDRYLHYFPIYNSGGAVFNLVPAMANNATLVLLRKFSASRFARQLHDYDISLCMMNAPSIRMVMNNPETEWDRDHRAWRMTLGLTLPPEEIRAFEARFNTRLCPTYGLTEGMTNVIGDPVGPRRLGSAGRIVPGYTLRLVGEDGAEVGQDTPGEVHIRSDLRHGLSPGYFRDEDNTRQAFVDGWLRTGDVLKVDTDGYVWWVERSKDMIKRSGFNVAPAEIERVIQRIDGVVDVGVVGVPDRTRDEAIVAFTTVDDHIGLTADKIMAICQDELADYKVPQEVRLVPEIPRNALGKVDRKLLRGSVIAQGSGPTGVRDVP